MDQKRTVLIAQPIAAVAVTGHPFGIQPAAIAGQRLQRVVQRHFVRGTNQLARQRQPANRPFSSCGPCILGHGLAAADTNVHQQRHELWVGENFGFLLAHRRASAFGPRSVSVVSTRSSPRLLLNVSPEPIPTGSPCEKFLANAPDRRRVPRRGSRPHNAPPQYLQRR